MLQYTHRGKRRSQVEEELCGIAVSRIYSLTRTLDIYYTSTGQKSSILVQISHAATVGWMNRIWEKHSRSVARAHAKH
jgi:hypothetical protein